MRPDRQRAQGFGGSGASAREGSGKWECPLTRRHVEMDVHFTCSRDIQHRGTPYTGVDGEGDLLLHGSFTYIHVMYKHVCTRTR